MKKDEIEEVKKALRRLRKTAIDLGLDGKTILSTVPKKYRYRGRGLNIGVLLFQLTMISVAFIVAIYISLNFVIFSMTHESRQVILNAVHSLLHYLDLATNQCLISISPFLVMYFRPPLDCEFCKQVSSIKRVSNLSTEDFFAYYAYTGRPIVVADGFKELQTQKPTNFTIGNIRSMYNSSKKVFDSCQYFPYKSSYSTLKEFMETNIADLSKPDMHWYIGWGNCDPLVGQKLRQLYERPYFLGDEVEVQRTDWIFMGKPGPGAFMHIDVVHSPTWQAQIKGYKKWTLQPPSECYYECKGGNMEVTLSPGEIIVFDSNRWFHKTEVTGEETSIAIGAEFE